MADFYDGIVMEQGPTIYQFDDVRVDLKNFKVFKAGQAIHLEPKAVRSLIFLIEHRGRLIEKSELLDAVWQDAFVTENAMTKVIAKLRKALGEGSKEAKYIETVPTRGYRFIAQVEVKDRPLRGEAINSLAVLPFLNLSADPNMEYLSDGITETLINSLARLSELRVMARSIMFRYKGQAVNPLETGLELGVRAVVTGRVLQLGDRLIIGAELVNVADGSQLWGEQYTRKLSDIFSMQEEIAGEISDKLQLRLSREQKKVLAKRYTEDPEAYKLYLMGTYYRSKWTDEGFKKSIERFKQAIDRDPNYALAYAGLAQTYVRLGLQSVMPPKDAYPQAKAAALQAVEIDDTLAEAHASLGFVRQLYDWDWAAAKSEMQRAIEINPNDAEAHYIYCYHFVHLGQWDEAIKEIRQVKELDPLSVEYMVGAADVYKDARRYDQAIGESRKALEMDSSYGQAHLFLGQAYEYKGRYEEAIAEYQEAMRLIGNTPEIAASIGHAYAVSGKKDEARKVIEDLKELANRRYVDPCYLAVVYAGLDDKDEAFNWLEKAYQDRSGVLVHAKVEPIFDDLRTDPRFTDLLRRVGLVPHAV